MRGFLIGLAPFAVLAGAGILVEGIKDEVNPPTPPTGLDAHESHASASLLGQFRTSVSSWLWLRTDLYLHNGVEMRPLSDGEKSAGKRGVGGTYGGHEALHDDNAIVTVVPDSARDFRGVLGDVERAVKAFKDMKGHEHRDPAQALPLFRLMTWFDPQFVLAWVTGATIIARDRSEAGTRQAIAFLAEGEEHNPNSVALPTEMGRLVLSRRQDLAGARPHLETAMARGKLRAERLNEIERDGLQLACRLLALVYRDLNEPQQMRRHLQTAVELFPQDEMLKRLAQGEPGPAPAPEHGHDDHHDHSHAH